MEIRVCCEEERQQGEESDVKEVGVDDSWCGRVAIWIRGTTVRAQNMAIDYDSPAKQSDSHVVQERPPIAEGQASFSNAYDLIS
ncbi:hypothetical protein YC2023_005035 [Brassica napus]